MLKNNDVKKALDKLEISSGVFDIILTVDDCKYILFYIKKLEGENERLKAEIDLLNDNRHYLNNKIGKAIIFIRKNIELNNGALSNSEKLIVSKHDLIKNETDVLNLLIKILKGSEE